MLFVEEHNDENEIHIVKVIPNLFSFAVYDSDEGQTAIYQANFEQLCEIHKHLGELIKEAKK
jgi:hypothetical protein